MRWALVALLAANVLVAAYSIGHSPGAGDVPDPRAREMNADKVQILQGGSGSAAAAAADAAKGPGARAGGELAPRAVACLEWGTFAPGELARAQTALAEVEPGRTLVRDLGLNSAWWLYVPPLRSRDEAEQRALEIRQAGVQDARVVSESERWRNAISLGIFKTEEAATAQLARVRAAQVQNAAVVQRNNLLRLASIVIVEPAPALVGRLTELQRTFAGTALKAVACPQG